ncbi:MAG: hypothetical protein H7Z10_14185 [Gemmatimonadaceae bacterium]|nr:hypothetical protein [Acetobacteraceae bacterium]
MLQTVSDPPSLSIANLSYDTDCISEVETALLALADPCLDSRISLIGPNTIELLCALIHRGYARASATRVCDFPQTHSADVAIVAHVGAPDAIGRAVAHARRVLTPLGAVAMHLPGDSALTQHARRSLLLHGFGAIRTRTVGGATLLRAELPLYGRLACA